MDKEIEEARKEAIPKKTRQGTEWVWDAWRETRRSQGYDIPILTDRWIRNIKHIG